MLEVPKFLNIQVKSGVRSKVEVPVKSAATTDLTVNASASCTCTSMGDKSFIIKPNETIIREFAITRTRNGSVTVTFYTSGKYYPTTLNVTVV